EGHLERHRDRAVRRHRGGGGQPLLPARRRHPRGADADAHAHGLPLEGHGQLLHRSGGRRQQRRRGLDLPRAQARRRPRPGPGGLLEGCPRRRL
ncbi:MAG: hypothetical protein AVDCRST_MAG48-1809, partial [uncultured Friedmanniella sp.]